MPCSLTLDRITTRRRRRLLRTASLVLAIALLAPGFATADPESPPLPVRYSQSACHRLVMDAGRMIAWARWEQRLSLERVRTGPIREGTPDWVVHLVQGWVTDAYQWQPTNEQIHQWARELGSTTFLPRVDQLTKHETIAIWLRRIARACPEQEAAPGSAALPVVAADAGV